MSASTTITTASPAVIARVIVPPVPVSALHSSSVPTHDAPLNVPGLESTVWKLTYPVLRAYLRWGLAISPERAERSMNRTREIFADVEARLAQNGSGYLVGERFTLADLSFAALSGPALLVTEAEGYDARLPTIEEAPAELGAFAREMRQTMAGQFAMRMFAEERGTRAEAAAA